MKTMKKTTLGIRSLTIAFLAVTIGVGTVLAYRGDLNVKGPQYSVERHDAMTKAFANNDYDAWKKLTANNHGNASNLITKENFAKFVEAHNLALAGKTVEAEKIRKELGLGLSNGKGSGLGKNLGKIFSNSTHTKIAR